MAIVFNSTVAQEQEQLQGWYQIDVILFKPKTADLDDESWPDVTTTYPADVTAVTDGELFNLSQLEQLDVLLPTAPVDVEPELGTNEFINLPGRCQLEFLGLVGCCRTGPETQLGTGTTGIKKGKYNRRYVEGKQLLHRLNYNVTSAFWTI